MKRHVVTADAMVRFFQFQRVLSAGFHYQNTVFVSFSRRMSGLSLQDVVNRLETFAPLKYAEGWDNVGLLIEPYTEKKIETILLTNDLTEKVLKEAIEKKADMILSYHPPIFAPVKRITKKTWKERLISICLENRIALYSPHTSWDCVKNGVCDWLCCALPYETMKPVTPHTENDEFGHGRVLTIGEDLRLKDCLERVKQHAGIKSVHVALGVDHNMDTKINTVGLCAGSGVSVLKSLSVDLLITGEMSHHDVLDETQRNISVILCNHSNSERGFLLHFKGICEKMLEDKVNIYVSETDSDPLETY